MFPLILSGEKTAPPRTTITPTTIILVVEEVVKWQRRMVMT
jgi:hypothetical protein